ncbi:MAG: squalene synthase HpnC [Sphingomonas sp.]
MAASATQDGFASGKGHRDENFPVASILLRRAHRAPVMAFYRFAREADDVADHPDAAPAEKLARLDAMRAGLDGRGGIRSALALRDVMTERGLSAVHAHDLLDAFVQDVTVRRYPDWDALIGYCTKSAMPVGRYVLDVHGEDRATWGANDALCAALQIINHLQDCGKDYRALDRVYLPQDRLAANGADAADLAAPAASPALRRTIAALADATQALLDASAGFAALVRDRRLAAEVAIIHRLAGDLNDRLKRRDPLSERVHHRPWEALRLAGGALIGRIGR